MPHQEGPSIPGSPLPLVVAQQEYQRHIKTHVHINRNTKGKKRGKKKNTNRALH